MLGQGGAYHSRTVTARDATELPERAGVPTAFVERLVDLGIVAAADDGRSSDADVFKVRFVRSSDLGGLSIEAIALDLRRTLDLLDLLALDLLDFASARTADANETHFVYWIFVGFRARLNIRSQALWPRLPSSSRSSWSKGEDLRKASFGC